MASYVVTVRTSGFEEWIVEAESEDDAQVNFFDGEMVASEVRDSEVTEVYLDD